MRKTAEKPLPAPPAVSEFIRELPLEERRTNSEIAYQELRRKILVGEFPPGEKLKVEVLQRDFQLSSTPLREALNRLTAEGLVVFEDNKGFRTAPISESDLRDITQLRLLIEWAALEDSMAHGDSEWEGRIVSASHRLDRIDAQVIAETLPRNGEWTQLHKGFHMALLSACTYPRMVSMCDSLFDQSERYRRLSTRIRVVRRDTMGEHRQMMTAVLERNVSKARELLTNHIQKTSMNVGSILGANKESPGVKHESPVANALRV